MGVSVLVRLHLVVFLAHAVARPASDRRLMGSVETLNTTRLVFGTVLPLSADGAEKDVAREILAGYRFWVERTNSNGGVLVGNHKMEAVLKVYDSFGDQHQQNALYLELVEENIDFLLGGWRNSTQAMLSASRGQLISMTSPGDDTFQNTPGDTHVFGVHPSGFKSSALRFVETSRSVWDLSRLAVVGIGPAGGMAHTECSKMLSDLNRSGIDVTLVHWEWVEREDDKTVHAAAARVGAAGADFMVGCVGDAESASALVRAAGDALLRGWNVHYQDKHCEHLESREMIRAYQTVLPQVIESGQLALLFINHPDVFTDSFAHAVSGWAGQVAGPALWHPDVSYGDPYWGSSSEVTAAWKRRADFGNGEGMSVYSAAAVATGEVLQMAIEAAGSVETTAVAAALRDLDAETFFGRVSFGADGSNTALESLVVQWDCSPLSHCIHRLRVPAVTDPLQPYVRACPTNQMWLEPSLVGQGPVQEGLRPEKTACAPCFLTDVTLALQMSIDEGVQAQMAAACPIAYQPVRVGAAAMARPGDDDMIRGVEEAIDHITANHPVLGLFFSTTVSFEAVPLHAQYLQPTLSGQQNGEVALGVVGAINRTAGQIAYARVEAEVEAVQPQGALLWNEGLLRELGVSTERAVCAGGGLQVSLVDVEMCISPAVRLQGRALAQLVSHLRWHRMHYVVEATPVYEEMAQELEEKAAELGLYIGARVTVPSSADSDEVEVGLVQIEDLDDCDAAVLVLLVSRQTAKTVFTRLFDGEQRPWDKGDRRFALLGCEAASRADNAPVGMLGMRTVGFAESSVAASIMQGAGQWGTGVSPWEEDAPWLEVGVEDRMLFAFDAVQFSIEAGMVSILSGEFVSPQDLRDSAMELSDRSPPLEYTTGPLRFQVSGSDALLLERVSGRFAFVNRRSESWRSIATLDLDPAEAMPIVHTVSAALGHLEWEQQAVEWGLSARPDGGKPSDTCACVLWRKMGGSPSLSSCRWAPEAVAVVVVGAVLLLGVAGWLWVLRRRRVEGTEDAVRQRMAELRARMKLRERDGFVLSSERQGLSLFRQRTARVIQGKQVEALARMTLLLDFDGRALDSLGWELRGHQLEVGDNGEEPNVELQVQYSELRAILLETSRVLLDPGVTFDTKGQPAVVVPKPKGLRGIEMFSDVVTIGSAPTRLSSSDAGSMAESAVRRKGRSSVLLRAQQPSRDERFEFFSKQVAQVQVWLDFEDSLFRELKEGHVQAFMNTLRAACDRQFEALLDEDRGQELRKFGDNLEDLRRPSAVPVAAVAGPPGLLPTATLLPPPECDVTDELKPGESLLRGTVTVEGDAMRETKAVASLPQPEGHDPVRGVRRQDHPRVRAIRLHAEDWREIELAQSGRTGSSRSLPSPVTGVRRPVLDEEVFISQLYRRAELLDEEFQLGVRRAVESRFGTKFGVYRAPVKTKARMREKLVSYGSADAGAELPLAANILDPVRASVVCTCPDEMLQGFSALFRHALAMTNEAAEQVAEWLLEEGPAVGLPVVRIKNKFALPDATEYDGYRDLMMCVLYEGSNGLAVIAEIQIHAHGLHNLKLQMHKLYKVKRAASANAI